MAIEDPAAILAELREEMQELEAVVAYFERRVANAAPPNEPASSKSTVPAKSFARMKAREAALAYLLHKGHPASTVEIREALVAGKVKTSAKKFHQTLYSTLAILQKQGEVVNLGEGIWGLAIWSLEG